jgi:hypothetical protein
MCNDSYETKFWDEYYEMIQKIKDLYTKEEYIKEDAEWQLYLNHLACDNYDYSWEIYIIDENI